MSMPRYSVWAVRAALLYLALGFTLGALLLFHKGIPISGALWAVLPLHIEALLVGWTVQLAIGVAFWILPRFRKPPKRGNERLAWLSFGLLNLGVWLVGLGPLLAPTGPLVLGGRLAEVLAGIAFVLHAWPRVKPPGA